MKIFALLFFLASPLCADTYYYRVQRTTDLDTFLTGYKSLKGTFCLTEPYLVLEVEADSLPT